MYANAAESRIVRNQDVVGSLNDQRRFPDKLIIGKSRGVWFVESRSPT